jgi:hypothetical protein
VEFGFKRKFETERSVAELKQHPTEKGKLQLSIDGISYSNWFRQKYQEFQKSIKVNISKNEIKIGKNKSFRI